MEVGAAAEGFGIQLRKLKHATSEDVTTST